MSKYLITLSPVDKFFFGGDLTFSVARKKEYNEAYKSYIIYSSRFPQQTSLLGMLRFLILRNSSCFSNGSIQDKDAASCLIGPSSFKTNYNGSENDFGAIRKLSSCYIQMIEEGRISRLYPCPLVSQPVWTESDVQAYYNGVQISLPELASYKAKEGTTHSLSCDGKTLSYGEVFLEDRRIGINRDIRSGKTESDALFKQVSYRFNNKDGRSFRFAFGAEVSDEVPLECYSGQQVSVGGDASWFVIQIDKCSEWDSEPHSADLQLTLVSPGCFPDNALTHVRFAATELIPFRFLQTSVANTKDYDILNGNINRSSKIKLYAPGSVFFFYSEEEKNAFEEIAASRADFTQIGFNDFK